jgi:voltage-gated potassium channel
METLPNLNKDTVQTLFYIEFVLIIIFCAEYTIRFLIAEKKLSFVLSFWGLVDLLAILPFFLLSFDMVLIRTLRLLRLLRILKLGRYSQSVNRMVNALKIAKEDLIIALLASIIMLIVAGFGIYQFENAAQPDKFSSVFESLWWALATLTMAMYIPLRPGGGSLLELYYLLVLA